MERWLDEDPGTAVETPEEDLEILRRTFSDPQLRRQISGEKGQQQNPDLDDPEESGHD